MADEMIKSTLDRRSEVKALKDQLNLDLQKSTQNVLLKSPGRRGQRQWD